MTGGGRADLGAGSGLAPTTATDEEAEAALAADLERRGVIVCSLATAIRDHAGLVRPHLGALAPLAEPTDGGLIGGSDRSDGTFVYVPPGVEIDTPLQPNPRSRGVSLRRFDRTLVVAAEGATVHTIEGCSAPVYRADPVRSTVVEVVVGPGASVTHTSIQNWSANVANLVIKRARVEAGGRMEWIDGNIGGRLSRTYPTVVLAGRGASGHVRSVAYAGFGQRQHTGARMIHAAPETVSTVLARAIAGEGGRCRHRTLVRAGTEAVGASSHIGWEGLVLDRRSAADTALRREVTGSVIEVDEWIRSRDLDGDERFYLLSRGLSAGEADALVVNGFIEPVTRALPMEYAVEWNTLVDLQMHHSVG